MTELPLVPVRLGPEAICRALSTGWRTTRSSRTVSMVYAGMVTLLGFAIMRTLVVHGMAPLVPLAAAAFMLLGPLLLAGFFGIARAVETGKEGGFSDLIRGFRQAPPIVFVLSLVCILLFMIFATDVATLYSYKIGGRMVLPSDLLRPTEEIASVLLWGGIAGLFIGFIVFSISAFSVALICERRAGLVRAITASVQVVFANPQLALPWAALISVSIMISIVILPLLPFTLPPLAYASHALYRQVFPSIGGIG